MFNLELNPFQFRFFSSFAVKSKTPDANQCKLSMKSCMSVLRNMKQVGGHNFWRNNLQLSILISEFWNYRSCMITLDTKSFKLVVQFKCRLETIKTHHIWSKKHFKPSTLQIVHWIFSLQITSSSPTSLPI